MCSTTIIKLVPNDRNITSDGENKDIVLVLNGKKSEVTQRIRNVVDKVKNEVLTLINQN